jgi:pyruvate dehydrogenase E1 component
VAARSCTDVTDRNAPDPEVLRSIERRVLWLSTAMVHHANQERPAGIKVGGHQASSASVASIMTTLMFAFLEAPDRISVKPHASPVLHAINFLLGRLDRSYLTTLRQYGGLQSYPSRTKDPDPVDYSTGSVGIGATASIWGALAHRYVAGQFDVPIGGRQVALVGDAELDEGAVWEAVVDPTVARLGEVMWIVDLNRQSLDRVVPDIAAGRLAAMFKAAGWHTTIVKYGRLLERLFSEPGGDELRSRIDAMSNEEYQRLLRADAGELRERLAAGCSPRLVTLLRDLDDAVMLAAIRDLGGHDHVALLGAYRQADAHRDRPSVIFAYTIKGWQLPTEGHPANHSALISGRQLAELAERLGADAEHPWEMFEAGSAEAQYCAATARRLARFDPPLESAPSAPRELGRGHHGRASTQQAFGRFLVDLVHDAPELATRVVTVSPDVASSTNLGGWINRRGVWSIGDRIDWFADDTDTLIRWRETDHGQHIELGIAETNLAGVLAELGTTWRRDGQPLLPIGTLYDPFVGRTLEPLSFAMYSGGQFILIGTPSGITLAPEGGAHQSIATPSIGIAQPGWIAWEPAFGQDLEWAMLYSLERLGRPDGVSAYFRLSTRSIDQSLAAVPERPTEREERRRAALAGGYRLRTDQRPCDVTLVGMGAVIPDVLAAADVLRNEAGLGVDVVCLTSAHLLHRALRARAGFGADDHAILDELFPPVRASPLVTVLDGHPHALAFLGAIRAVPVTCLGVDDFGQSGDLQSLYAHYGIDTEAIVGSALELVAPATAKTETGGFPL